MSEKWFTRMLKNVATKPIKYQNWIIEDGLLYEFHTSALLDQILSREEGWKLVIPEELRERIILEAHDTSSMRHFGVDKTFDV